MKKALEFQIVCTNWHIHTYVYLHIIYTCVKVKPKVAQYLYFNNIKASVHTLKLAYISEECSEVGTILFILQIQNWGLMWLIICQRLRNMTEVEPQSNSVTRKLMLKTSALWATVSLHYCFRFKGSHTIFLI